MEYKGLKIGIFTITDAINYGAFYQMYGMAKYFESRGADATVFYGKNSAKRTLIKYFTPNPTRQVRKLKMLYKFEKDSKALQLKEYKNEALDVAILGSDEIWNLENNSFDHFEYYYGEKITAKKKIAYAPSVGFANPETLINSTDFANGLKKLDLILARDKMTQSIAEKITGKNIEMVVDPTILFNDWSSIKLKPLNFNSEYILYYGYTSSPPFLDEMLKLSQELNLPIISAGYNIHSWASENLAISPMEFLSLLNDAKFVFTTTFHGTVMSTLYKKNFCYQASGQKVKDFGEKFDIESHHIDHTSSTHDIELALNSGFKSFDDLLNTHMNNSRDILEKTIL